MLTYIVLIVDKKLIARGDELKRERLIQERKKRNKSRAKIAYALDISEVYVRKIENGQASPGREVLVRFSNYYGLGVKLLFPDLFSATDVKKIIRKDESL